MRSLLLAVLIGLVPLPALADPAPEDAATQPGEPTYPEGFVLQPTFRTDDGRYPAGTAFAVTHHGKVAVVMPYHLLGPAGGLPAQLSPDQVGTAVKLVVVNDKFTNKEAGRSESLHALPDTAMFTESVTRDLVAFETEKSEKLASSTVTTLLRPGRFADAPPKVGDPIWLAGFAPNSTPADKRLHPAVVVEVAADAIYFEYTAPIELPGTSGAPLLDASGAVVGMALGGGEQDGKTFGAACPMGAIQERLDKMFPAAPAE